MISSCCAPQSCPTLNGTQTHCPRILGLSVSWAQPTAQSIELHTQLHLSLSRFSTICILLCSFRVVRVVGLTRQPQDPARTGRARLYLARHCYQTPKRCRYDPLHSCGACYSSHPWTDHLPPLPKLCAGPAQRRRSVCHQEDFHSLSPPAGWSLRQHVLLTQATCSQQGRDRPALTLPSSSCPGPSSSAAAANPSSTVLLSASPCACICRPKPQHTCSPRRVPKPTHQRSLWRVLLLPWAHDRGRHQP